MKKMLLASAASVLAMAQLATAAPILTGNVTNPAWSPDSPAVRALDGVTPVVLTETGPSTGIFSLTLTPAQHLLSATGQPDVADPVGMYKFKTADSVTGWASPYNTPSADMAVFIDAAVAASNITFTLVTVAQNDGFLPDVGSGATTTGYVYTSAWRTWVDANASQLRLVGAFQSELGGTDWDQANGLVMSDTLDGDPAGDGIYKYKMTGLPAGNYAYKILVKPTTDPAPFDPSFTNRGLAKDSGGALTVTAIAPTDTITITFDANTGRTKFTNDNPSLNPGPPFFATSAAWGETLDAATQLTDQGAGLFARIFTVPTAGDHQVRVRQYVGRTFSESGDYPFTTTVNNQTVLVAFDRNNYADGYLPASDFVVVLDATTRASLNSWEYAQVVIGIDGLGGVDADDFGFGGDFDANFAPFQSQDNGTAPDTTAGDQIFSRSITPTATDDPGLQWKFVARRTGKSDTGYKIQVGGALNGLTIDGNNDNIPMPTYAAGTPATFKADLITGRVGVNTTGALADPVRGSYFNPASSVPDWTMF